MEAITPKPLRLTARYGALHGCYWSIYCCMFSFAAAFLMAKGYTASQAGVMLALSCLFSCMLQPGVAALADKSERISLQTVMICTLGVSFGCLIALRLLPLSGFAYAGMFLLGALLLDLTLPLINALSVYYADRDVPVNFGLGRGVGSISYAGASMLLGFVMERRGADAMLSVAIVIYALLILLIVTFPRIRAVRRAPAQADGANPAAVSPRTDEAEEPCTLFQFFTRYRWFSVSLFGVLLLAAFHAMTENYLITVLRRLGGDSGDLGVALAIATVVETPVILFFSRYQQRLKIETWLIVAAISFFVKSVFLLLAQSVTAVMINQTLQFCSYGLYVPASVLYARKRIRSADMVKGQAMMTAFYALGCSLGNFMGGRLIDGFGVNAMLLCGVGFAAGAALVLIISTSKHERNETT